MAEVFKRWFSGAHTWLFVLSRLLVGFLFFAHGAQKMFGWFGGTMVTDINLFWFAGLIELLIGLGVFFGVFVRLATLCGSIYMIVVFITAHTEETWMPLMNGGEAATLFFAAFLVLLVYGAGRLSLERALLKREVF